MVIYNKVNEPPRGYDVVAEFGILGNLAYESWGGEVCMVTHCPFQGFLHRGT